MHKGRAAPLVLKELFSDLFKNDASPVTLPPIPGAAPPAKEPAPEQQQQQHPDDEGMAGEGQDEEAPQEEPQPDVYQTRIADIGTRVSASSQCVMAKQAATQRVAACGERHRTCMPVRRCCTWWLVMAAPACCGTTRGVPILQLSCFSSLQQPASWDWLLLCGCLACSQFSRMVEESHQMEDYLLAAKKAALASEEAALAEADRGEQQVHHHSSAAGRPCCPSLLAVPCSAGLDELQQHCAKASDSRTRLAHCRMHSNT